MGRIARTKLDTRTARARLAPRPKPYNTTVAPGRMLGYARPVTGAGRWVAIVEVGRGPTGAALRRQGDLGLADDASAADGVSVLTYAQAFGEAAKWQPDDGTRRNAKLTVREALESYVKAKRAKDGESLAGDARRTLALHVLREDAEGKPLPGPRGLGDRPVDGLTLTELRAWRDGLVDGRTKATVNRIMANFRAALNYVFSDESSGISSDSAWRRLEGFKAAGTRREHHFSEAEVMRLIGEARKIDSPFADLLTAAFHTGARTGELAACDVRHVDARRHTLAIPSGKTGPRLVVLTDEGARWFAELAGDRDPREPLLSPTQGGRWAKWMPHRLVKAALAAAKLPTEASLYALRHTYISRAIENGMPLTLLAENVGTGVKMIEKNYAHMLAASRRALVEQTAPKLKLVVNK